MEKIHRLPSLLGVSAGIVIGFIGFLRGQAGRDLVMNMALSIVIFYIFGNFVKKTLQVIAQEVLVKKELERIENKKKEREKSEEEKRVEASKGQNLDLKAGDEINHSDTFLQEPVTSFIRQELNKN